MTARLRCLVVVALTILSPCLAFGQKSAVPWVGHKVVAKEQCPLMVGATVVDNGARHRIYTVEKADGDRLWLVAPGAPSGWMHCSKVVPFNDAIDYFNTQIHDHPKSAHAYLRLAAIWNDKREYDRAIASLDEAIRLDPNDPLAFNNRGWNWWSKGDGNRAIADYTEAIRLDPRSALTYGNRAAVRHARKEFEKALDDLNEAIRLDPKYAHAYSDRAWIWSTCPDKKIRNGKRAVASAERACELSGWNYADVVGTLAAAKAEVGDFARAVEWQSKANQLYSEQEARRDGIIRLALYREKKPFRERE